MTVTVLHMRRRFPSAFFEACQALERGELALASLRSDALNAELPDAAEAQVLTALVERRAQRGYEPWIESLLSSWEACGRPTGFSFLKGRSWDDELEEAVVAGTAGEAFGNFFSEHTGVIGRKWMLTSPAELLEEAQAQLEQPMDLLVQLVTAGQLATVRRDPELREQAQALIEPLHRKIAVMNPGTFELAALPVVDEISKLGHLDAEHVQQLCDLLAYDGHVELERVLYKSLVTRLGVITAHERRLAFLDVGMIMPDPAFTIHCRAREALPTPALLELIEQLGERDAKAAWVSRRILGLELLKLGAQRTGRHSRVDEISGMLLAARRLTDEPNRFDLDWPIEPLQCELSDALAEDELGLLTRCVFPHTC